MTPTLGKRKRRDLVDQGLNLAPSQEHVDSKHIQVLFKQHFESKFEPLPIAHTKFIQATDTGEAEVTDESISDWGGISDDEDRAEIVEHTISKSCKADMPTEEVKSFMTSKPPSSCSTIKAEGKRISAVAPEDAKTDAANLKKDLALQHLLKESHLLGPESSLSHTGSNRHEALDLRLQDLGSKSSIFSQQKMPLAQRKGITAKAAEKEEERRREAQENGIILEKARKGKGRADVKRQKHIGGPSIGNFQGGMLKLSKKDVAAIEGPKKASRGKR